MVFESVARVGGRNRTNDLVANIATDERLSGETRVASCDRKRVNELFASADTAV